MKKGILLLMGVCFLGVAFAQQGSWYVGGVANYGAKTTKQPNNPDYTLTSWAFGPEVGTFLKDNLQLGLYLGLSGSSEKDDNGEISSSSNFSPTLYTRKFFTITDNFSAFGGLYLSYISGSATNYAGTGAERKTSGFGARLGIGVAYALSPRFTVVGQYGLLGYQSVSFKSNGNDAGSESSFDFGVNTIGYGSLGQTGGVFNVGLYYTFKTN